MDSEHLSSTSPTRVQGPEGPDVIGVIGAVPPPTLSEAIICIAQHIELDATEEAKQEVAVLRQAADEITALRTALEEARRELEQTNRAMLITARVLGEMTAKKEAAEASLSAARNGALEEAAKVCDANANSAPINPIHIAKAIRAMKAGK